MPDKTKLTGRMENFAQAHVRLGDATLAYRESYSAENMQPATVNRRAYEMKKLPKVAVRIRQLMEEAAEKVVIDKSFVLAEWFAIATADANDIVSHRRVNCRHCYGVDHEHQYKDAAEFAAVVADAMDLNATRRRRGHDAKPLPTDKGGYGYRSNASPHANCPQCHGEGTGEVFVSDTRRLKGNAKKLYAGVKQGKHGIEIQTRDKDAALANIAKHLGMFDQTLKIVGPGGGPVQTTDIPVPTDPIEAARFYQQLMKGN